MGTGVNVKMGVSGVAQFKQGMKESQAAVKTLDQALKLNEQALKNNGDAEQYLQNKTALLERQIKEQKSVVEQAEAALIAMRRNGVSETSAAFQQMQQQSYKAQEELLKMQANLEGIGDAGQGAQEGVTDMNGALRRIGDGVSYQNVIDGINSITSAMEKAGKAAFNMGKKIIMATLDGGQWADELQTTADKWEVTPEQVWRMQYTAAQIDTEAETIFNSRKKLIAAMGKESNKETMGAFAALGISDLSGTDENIGNVYWQAGERLMAMQDKVARNEYAMLLYGRNFEDLIPIFKTGREEYEKTFNEGSWIGDKQFEALKKVDDEANKINSEWEIMKRTFEGTFAETMQPIMETATEMLKEFNTYLASEDGQQALADLSEAISGLFTDLSNIDPNQVMDGLKDAIKTLKEGLEWIKEHSGDLVTAMETMVVGWAGLKLTGGALKLLELINGLKWLKGKPNIPIPGTDGTTATGGGGLAKLLSGSTIAKAIGSAASSVTAVDPTGALALLPQALGDWTTFGRRLRNGGSLEEAATASVDTIKASAKQGLGNFTSYFTETLPKAIWGVMGVTSAEDLGKKIESAQFDMQSGAEDMQRRLFGGGEEHQYNITEEDLIRQIIGPGYRMGSGSTRTELEQSTDRMSQVAGEMNSEIAGMRQSNADMTSAAKGLSDMPGKMYDVVQAAIRSGMAGVNIYINAGAVDTIGKRISSGFSRTVQALTGGN